MGELMQQVFVGMGAVTAVCFLLFVVFMMGLAIFYDGVLAIINHLREEREIKKFFEMIEEFQNDFV